MPTEKSVTISPRRRLLEEVLEERSKVVAGLPIDQQEPPADSVLWSLGALRVAGRARRGADRGAVRDLAVLALAWLEAIDRQLPAERRPVWEDDPIG